MWKSRAIRIYISIIIWLLISPALADVTKLGGLDIKTEPTPKDWKYFHAMSPRDHQNLWERHEESGIKFRDWSWSWRIGWIRVCTFRPEDYCQGLLIGGLWDQALLVRAEAAYRIGNRYAGTENTSAIEILTKAFSNGKNWRNGKPLKIQNKIIHALYKIGGEGGVLAAKSLAASSDDTKVYFSKLQKQN